jgi:tetratricopeptide (TPR) repeat protein
MSADRGPQGDRTLPDPIARQVGLDVRATDQPYVLGRAFALLEMIQFAAQGLVRENGLWERFISAAAQYPAATWQELVWQADSLLAKMAERDALASAQLEKRFRSLLSIAGEDLPLSWGGLEPARFLLAAHKQRSYYRLSRESHLSGGGVARPEQGGALVDRSAILAEELAALALAALSRTSPPGRKQTMAARIGANMRRAREQRGMTPALLAAPEFSTWYILAVELGETLPRLAELTILAKRLQVPLADLLEEIPQGEDLSQLGAPDGQRVHRARKARRKTQRDLAQPVEPDPQSEVHLLHARILLWQGNYRQAGALLSTLQPARLRGEGSARLALLRGQVHLAAGEYQQAVTVLQAALEETHGRSAEEDRVRARHLLGKARYALGHYSLALEQHLDCLAALDSGRIRDPCSHWRSSTTCLPIFPSWATWSRQWRSPAGPLPSLPKWGHQGRGGRLRTWRSASTTGRRSASRWPASTPCAAWPSLL